MNFIQGLMKIRTGLETGDIQVIADGYEMLSGEKVEVSNYKSVQVNLQNDAFSVNLPKEIVDVIQNQSPPVSMECKLPKKRGRPRKNYGGNTPVDNVVETAKAEQILLGKEKKPNRFVDDGTQCSEDRDIDAKLHKVPPVPRRQAISLLTLQCDRCHKNYELHPDLYITGSRKLCNSCSRIGNG